MTKITIFNTPKEVVSEKKLWTQLRRQFADYAALTSGVDISAWIIDKNKKKSCAKFIDEIIWIKIHMPTYYVCILFFKSKYPNIDHRIS